MRASNAYAGVNERLLKILTRQLADEEDLIVPLILEKGSGSWGWGEIIGFAIAPATGTIDQCEGTAAVAPEGEFAEQPV